MDMFSESKIADTVKDLAELVKKLVDEVTTLSARVDKLERLSGGAALKSKGNIAKKATDPFRQPPGNG